MAERPTGDETYDIVVVGSGMAGLVCALSFAPQRVTLITKTPRLDGGSSLWAKGGIAAPVGPGDTPEEHASDTLTAGAGLSDPRRALDLAREGAGSLQLLIDEGVPFDRAIDGTLALAREAAHGSLVPGHILSARTPRSGPPVDQAVRPARRSRAESGSWAARAGGRCTSTSPSGAPLRSRP